MSELIFIKLGGSLITNKNTAHTLRRRTLHRLVREIKAALEEKPEMKVIVGHGSGSFGHIPAKKFNTRDGVFTAEGWIGLVEVWKEARALNQIVLETFHAIGLPVVAFPPSAILTCKKRKTSKLFMDPIQYALKSNLIPLINGDVVFDSQIGATILSTEEVFLSLSDKLRPKRILVAGIEYGVWRDFPDNTENISSIRPKDIDQVIHNLRGSDATDVTGGMLQKVSILIEIIKHNPDCEAYIFSGLKPGNLKSAMLGNSIGTRITNQ